MLEYALIGLKKNMMQANPGKFQFMLTGNHEMQLMLYDVVLDKDNYVNVLGVKIDKGLNFKRHVNEVSRKTGYNQKTIQTTKHGCQIESCQYLCQGQPELVSCSVD